MQEIDLNNRDIKSLERAKMLNWGKTVNRMISIIEEVAKCSG